MYDSSILPPWASHNVPTPLSTINTHTQPGAIDPAFNDFNLADRRTGELIGAGCVRTKVYVSTDGTDIDLGHFKREAWATQAMTLVQGRLHVDFAALDTNLAALKHSRKPLKHNTTAELDTIFMVEFECPAAAGSSNWRDNKVAHRPNFRAALRYVRPPTLSTLSALEDGTDVNLGTYYGNLLERLHNYYGVYASAPYAPTPQPYAYAPTPFLSAPAPMPPASVTATGDTPSTEVIHSPLCNAINSIGYIYACSMIWAGQLGFNNEQGVVAATSCKGSYPSFIQGFVDQGKDLKTDKNNNPLPGTFANLLQQNSGHLPVQVDEGTVNAEKATMFWLYDKVLQLAAWTKCDDGQVPFAFANALAQGFSAPTYYRITNTHEFPKSVNLTNPVLALSATGPDAASQNTFLLVVRGTIARSEWIADFKYNQINVTDAVLATRPILAPFKGMSIHAGYAGLFEQIYPGIMANVATAPPQRILVTGHSLGAGMTQLLALALALDFNPTRVDAAMFAPPAVGDHEFAEAFNTKVNGRRVAYVAYRPSTDPDDIVFTSMGDPVPQIPCPNQPVCYFPADPVPVSTKRLVDLHYKINYQAVDGNVLFDYRHLPDAPVSYTGLKSSIIRDTWEALKGSLNAPNAHKCSYACYFSSAVDVELTQCFIKPTISNIAARPDGLSLTQIKNLLPQTVQQYGMC